ncbi:hypothetical protein [Corynebacterium neomassiliense]|nr:hypothetical protein [Corynebacterium neomassiliense]
MDSALTPEDPEEKGPRENTMDLTVEDRAEWIDDAKDAIRGRMLLRMLSVEEAYTALSNEHVWRNELPSAVLQEAYKQMTTGEAR